MDSSFFYREENNQCYEKYTQQNLGGNYYDAGCN